MQNLILIPLGLAAGFFLKRQKIVPENIARTLNAIIIWLSFPALVLTQAPKVIATLDLTATTLLPLAAAWVSFGLAALIVSTIARRRGWSRGTTGALVLTTGLGNTSFLGFPLIEAFFGVEGLRPALILDQPGTFLALSTVGIFTASYYAGASVRPREIAKRVCTFPPFVAIVAALLLYRTNWLEPFDYALGRLAVTLVPLALLSVGAQLHVDPATLRRRARPLAFGLGVKLVLIPLLFAIALLPLEKDLTVRVTLIEVAMGSMLTSAIVADDFGLDPELASLMVGVGTPLALFTVSLWHLLY